MSLTERTVQVPADLLEATKKFDEERTALVEEGNRIQREAEEAYGKVVVKLNAAQAEIAKRFYEAKLLPENQPFFLDTRYVKDHDFAVVRYSEGQESPLALPLRTLN